jgi:hypothetical protein
VSDLQVSSGKRVTVASDAPDEVFAPPAESDQRHTARLESTLKRDGCRHTDETRRVDPPDGPRCSWRRGANQTLDAASG